MQLNPAIYEQEQARVAARFEEAVQLTEQTFISEFAKLIEHLTERLVNKGDGERKIFRDSAITNLTEFFGRFRQLNIRSNQELDELVEQAVRRCPGHRCAIAAKQRRSASARCEPALAGSGIAGWHARGSASPSYRP